MRNSMTSLGQQTEAVAKLSAGQKIAGAYTLKEKCEPSLPGTAWLARDDAGAEVMLHFLTQEVAGDTRVREAIRQAVRRSRQQ